MTLETETDPMPAPPLDAATLRVIEALARAQAAKDYAAAAQAPGGGQPC
jgi:hypothetical protein